MPAIEVNNVSKRFYLRYSREFLAAGVFRTLLRRQRSEELWALRDVSFSVERGESLAVIGPNGCGKTTLLSIISGVTEPTCGEVATKGRIAALLQLGAGFHPDLTGRENAYINAGVLGLRRYQIDEIYPRIAEFSELGHFLDAPIRRYSSGMLSRLGFAIAVHVSPDILIVDEVLGVGDQHFQRKCRDKIYEFIDGGVTILFVSHSPPMVRQLCRRAVYLEQGRMVAFGDVDEVLTAYNKHTDGGLRQQAATPPESKPASAAAAATVPAKPEKSSPPGSAPQVGTAKGESRVSRIRPIAHTPSGRFRPNASGVPSTTYFYRNAAQLAALFDEVFPSFKDQPTVRVRYWCCSIGCEPYSLALEYQQRNVTEYRLSIEALDSDPELVQACVQAEYNERELFYEGMSSISRKLVKEYFDRNEDNNYQLSDRIRSSVLFGVGDLLSEEAALRLPVDFVSAQNVLLHLQPDDARRAMANLVAQVDANGVLAVGGTDPDILVETVEQHGLEPISYQLEEIHNGWRLRRSRPDSPFGLGPFDRTRADSPIRYCSLFRKPL